MKQFFVHALDVAHNNRQKKKGRSRGPFLYASEKKTILPFLFFELCEEKKEKNLEDGAFVFFSQREKGVPVVHF